MVQGRASAWQKHLILTPTTPGASEAVRHSQLGAAHCVRARRVVRCLCSSAADGLKLRKMMAQVLLPLFPGALMTERCSRCYV